MIVVGLTGSIAMGKTETARMFRAAGIPVFDADAAVHTLYDRNGGAVAAVAKLFPAALVEGRIDRGRLSRLVLGDSAAIAALEAIVHPLVWAEERKFLDAERAAGSGIAVIDNPLLLESGRDHTVDVIAVVSAPPDIQRGRALARPGMSPEKLDALLARQMPDAEKRARADFVIDTSQGLDAANGQVRHIIKTLRESHA
jgi:dephospho-CoA kinase